MADDFPDLHHKLCKQLAALTTAMYHLNTKNDENDLILQTYIQTYEQEMDNIVQSANQIIDKHLKDNTQARELHEIHTSYKAFKGQIEEARATSVQEFNIFQENMKEKERIIQEEADKQVNMYKTEVENLKEKIWHMQKLVEKMSGAEVKFDEEEQKARERENQRIKKELEDKYRENEIIRMRYNELEMAYRELEDSYAKLRTWGKDSLDNNSSGPKPAELEIEELKGKISDQERLIVALRKAISQENGLYEGDYVASIEFGGNSGREVSLGLQVNNLQKEVVASERLLKEKDEEIDKLKDQLKEHFSDERVQQKIEDYENRLKEASREHKKMIEKLSNEHSEVVAEMENHFERESIHWQAILQGMQATLDSRNEYINGLEERFKMIELEKEEFEKKAQDTVKYQAKENELNTEIEKLKHDLEEMRRSSEQKLKSALDKAEEDKRKAIEEMRLENEQSAQKLKEELGHRKSLLETQKETKIKELEAKIKELETELQTLKQYPLQQLEVKTKEVAEEYQNKVNELSKRHNANIRELMEKHEEKLQQTNKKYEKELSDLKKELQQEKDNMLKMKEDDKNSEVIRVKKDYEAKLKKISKSYDKQLEEKLQEYEAKIKSKEVEIVELRKDIDSAKDELKKNIEKLQGKEENNKGLKKLVEDQKNTIELLQDEMRDGFLEEGGSTFRNELSKIKDMDFTNKGREDIMVEHLKYAERMEKKFRELKKQAEERAQILTQRYNELLAIFENRPSRSEDLSKIKQLEEELRKPSDKTRINAAETVRKDDYQVFNSHPNFNGTMMLNSIRSKKNAKAMSPTHITNSLPPISITQFSIQLRTPPAANPLMTTKKFFK